MDKAETADAQNAADARRHRGIKKILSFMRHAHVNENPFVVETQRLENTVRASLDKRSAKAKKDAMKKELPYSERPPMRLRTLSLLKVQAEKNHHMAAIHASFHKTSTSLGIPRKIFPSLIAEIKVAEEDRARKRQHALPPPFSETVEAPVANSIHTKARRPQTAPSSRKLTETAAVDASPCSPVVHVRPKSGNAGLREKMRAVRERRDALLEEKAVSLIKKINERDDVRASEKQARIDKLDEGPPRHTDAF